MAEQKTNPTTEYIPETVSAPGETLADLLEEHDMSQADLALRTGRPRKTINEIIKGKASITPETAIQLERVFGTPAEFWLRREAHYQEHLARRKVDEELAADTDWLNSIPVKELQERGLIEKTKDKVRQMVQCLRFFGVASASQYQEVYAAPQAQFRRSSAFEIDGGAVAAWLRMGEIEAQKIACEPYDVAAFQVLLIQLRALVKETDPRVFIPDLQRRCATVGVAVVFVREVAGCRTSGVTRWLSPHKALVQLSVRYKTNDHLWFTFFHEAGHIVLHGKRDVFLEGAGKAGSSREEEEANIFARDLLIPSADYRRLCELRPRTRASVQQFADEIGIHPAIVVGRLQHDGLLPRSHLNDMKQRYAWHDDADGR